jgi:hypothetical protein
VDEAACILAHAMDLARQAQLSAERMTMALNNH